MRIRGTLVAVSSVAARSPLPQWSLIHGSDEIAACSGAPPTRRRRADLPGDDLLAAPDILSTRAITIDAPAAAIWPWLVQFGPGCGGAYTYDWIENLLGLDIHSTDRILPEFQHLEVGDAFPLGAKGPVVRVASIDPKRSVVFRSDDGHWVWSFTLVETDNRTRLLSRNRIASPDAGPIGRLVNTAIMEPGSLVMERKMLHGFKDRVERPAVPADLG